MQGILLLSEFCQRLDYSRLGDVGTCLMEVGLQQNVTLLAIIMLFLFGGLLIRFNFPIALLLPFGLALMYLLYIMTYEPIFLALIMLIAIIMGALMIIGFLKYLNR